MPGEVIAVTGRSFFLYIIFTKAGALSKNSTTWPLFSIDFHMPNENHTCTRASVNSITDFTHLLRSS